MITQLTRFSMLALCALLAFVPTLRAADTNGNGQKDAAAVMNSFRVKRLAKDLELTETQQKKVLAIFEEESKATAKFREDSSMGVLERKTKIKEAQDASYAKIKPLLTPPQLEKFEKSQAAAAKPKK